MCLKCVELARSACFSSCRDVGRVHPADGGAAVRPLGGFERFGYNTAYYCCCASATKKPSSFNGPERYVNSCCDVQPCGFGGSSCAPVPTVTPSGRSCCQRCGAGCADFFKLTGKVARCQCGSDSSVITEQPIGGYDFLLFGFDPKTQQIKWYHYKLVCKSDEVPALTVNWTPEWIASNFGGRLINSGVGLHPPEVVMVHFKFSLRVLWREEAQDPIVQKQVILDYRYLLKNKHKPEGRPLVDRQYTEPSHLVAEKDFLLFGFDPKTQQIKWYYYRLKCKLDEAPVLIIGWTPEWIASNYESTLIASGVGLHPPEVVMVLFKCSSRILGREEVQNPTIQKQIIRNYYHRKPTYISDRKEERDFLLFGFDPKTKQIKWYHYKLVCKSDEFPALVIGWTPDCIARNFGGKLINSGVGLHPPEVVMVLFKSSPRVLWRKEVQDPVIQEQIIWVDGVKTEPTTGGHYHTLDDGSIVHVTQVRGTRYITALGSSICPICIEEARRRKLEALQRLQREEAEARRRELEVLQRKEAEAYLRGELRRVGLSWSQRHSYYRREEEFRREQPDDEAKRRADLLSQIRGGGNGYSSRGNVPFSLDSSSDCNIS